MDPRENSVRQHIKMLDFRLTELGPLNFLKKKAINKKLEVLQEELKAIMSKEE